MALHLTTGAAASCVAAVSHNVSQHHEWLSRQRACRDRWTLFARSVVQLKLRMGPQPCLASSGCLTLFSPFCLTLVYFLQFTLGTAANSRPPLALSGIEFVIYRCIEVMSPSTPTWLNRKRPGTKARTRARGKLQLSISPTPSRSSSVSASAQLSRSRRETGGNHIAVLNRLLRTLETNQVPGPQFFRLEQEFSKPLGEGGQGNVRGINEKSAKLYRKADKNYLKHWPVNLIAIKQYQAKQVNHQPQDANSQAQEVERSEHDLANRFRAAECEVLALSPNLFRNNPNIVQLMGWGLCLDTLESHDSPCCRYLQTPILVLERAEWNLLEFLRRLFPTREYAPDIQVERGISACRPHKIGVSIPASAFRSTGSFLSQFIGLTQDPYEVVRLLCIDIGHGLGSLHENGFTHGDLKPQNVLIFRHHVNGFRAKLCDFGCAYGKVEEEPPANETPLEIREEKESYYGTEEWLPPRAEADDKHDFEGLRKCDLFVYGLVVWCSFFRRGEPPPKDPGLLDAKADIDDFLGGRRWMSRSKRRLADRVRAVLEQTLKPYPDSRDYRPWEYLESSAKEVDEARKAAQRTQSSPDNGLASNAPLTLCPASIALEQQGQTPAGELTTYEPLPLAVRARYKERSWWLRDTAIVPLTPVTATDDHTISADDNTKAPLVVVAPVDAEHSDSGQDSLDTPLIVVDSDSENHTDSTPLPPKAPVIVVETTEEEGFGPASAVPLTYDDNYRSMKLFRSERRQKDTQELFRLMKDAIESWEGKLSNREDLYCYARFRSRVRLKWWTKGDMGVNLLARALILDPPVDIRTLAWLCNGPIGKSDVLGLSNSSLTWEFISDPKFLNESECLDRFLLLLQFGARVEQKLSFSTSGPGSSIFSMYLRHCRPAIVPTVMAEICRRLDEVMDDEHMAETTRNYMTSPGPRGSEATAITDLKLAGNKAAVTVLQRHILLSRKTSQTDNPQSAPSETTSLLGNLPPGWEHLGKSCRVTGPALYEEDFTNSITLHRPKIGLMRLREIEIGFLDLGQVSHLDLDSYLQPGAGTMSRKNFASDLTSRFPSYNEDWFETEWTTEHARADILGAIREPWRLPSFSVRVPVPELDVGEWLV